MQLHDNEYFTYDINSKAKKEEHNTVLVHASTQYILSATIQHADSRPPFRAQRSADTAQPDSDFGSFAAKAKAFVLELWSDIGVAGVSGWHNVGLRSMSEDEPESGSKWASVGGGSGGFAGIVPDEGRFRRGMSDGCVYGGDEDNGGESGEEGKDARNGYECECEGMCGCGLECECEFVCERE